MLKPFHETGLVPYWLEFYRKQRPHIKPTALSLSSFGSDEHTILFLAIKKNTELFCQMGEREMHAQ